jgi:hypothetical protein
MLRRVSRVGTDVSEGLIASPITGKTLKVLEFVFILNVVTTSLIISTVMLEVTRSSETSVLTRDTASHSRKVHSSKSPP